MGQKLGKADNEKYFFVQVELQAAYKKFHTDLGPCDICQAGYMFIKPTPTNGLKRTALLYFLCVRKLNPTFKVTVPFHARRIKPEATRFKIHGIAEERGEANPGMMTVSIQKPDDHVITWVPEGTPIPNTQWGDAQFTLRGEGENYVPERGGVNSRNDPEIKKESLYLSKAQPAIEEHFVVLLEPGAEESPQRIWLEEVDNYGVVLGNDEYRMRKVSMEPSHRSTFPTTSSSTSLSSSTSTSKTTTIGVPEVPPKKYFLDNDEPNAVKEGVWNVSSGANPFAATSEFTRTPGSKYTFNLQDMEPGEYNVFGWWTEFGSRIATVPIEIHHAGGVDTVVVNQKQAGGIWNMLGRFTFNVTAKIVVFHQGDPTNQLTTCADAFQLERIEAPPQEDEVALNWIVPKDMNLTKWVKDLQERNPTLDVPEL
jgi:hypothetical protein